MTSPFTGTTSFGGQLCPPDVTARILNMLVDNAPFAASLTRLPTQRGSVSFPVANPTGWSWVAEGAKIPQIDLGDDVVTVASCKLAGVLRVSNEMIHDSSIRVTDQVSQLLKDGLSADVDKGLLYGTGPATNQPIGIVDSVIAVDGPDLLSGVAAAVGQIGDAGGTATRTALSGSALAAESVRNSEAGNPLYPGATVTTLAGTTPVVVPSMPGVLAYDPSRLYLIISEDSTVAVSPDFYFDLDSTALRIVARLNIASPVPDKAARRVNVVTTP